MKARVLSPRQKGRLSSTVDNPWFPVLKMIISFMVGRIIYVFTYVKEARMKPFTNLSFTRLTMSILDVFVVLAPNFPSRVWSWKLHQVIFTGSYHPRIENPRRNPPPHDTPCHIFPASGLMKGLPHHVEFSRDLNLLKWLVIAWLWLFPVNKV